MALIIMLYLTVLGIKDLKERQIQLTWLAAGAAALTSMGIYRCIQGELSWVGMLTGMIPGILLLLMARLSGKAGYADGIVLLELGLCLGYRESMFLFCLALLLLSAVSVILLLLGKAHRHTKMPYLSFVAIVFLLRQL